MKTLPLVCSFASVALMSATTMRTFAQVEAPVKPVIAIDVPQSAQQIPAPAPIVRIVDAANGSEPVVSMVFDETQMKKWWDAGYNYLQVYSPKSVVVTKK